MGLIGRIGNWTLQEACRQVSEWRQAGFDPPRVAVNLSAIQIKQDGVPGQLKELLGRFQIDPAYLELEIVEGVVVESLAETSETLRAIRELGVHISIDDYGTGYSSLSYLKYLPVNTLKIDRCFITNLCTDTSDQAIVKSTVVLAHSLSLSVIAEGVETAEQANLLRELGCDQVQGYYCSRPVIASKFEDFLGEVTPLLAGMGDSQMA